MSRLSRRILILALLVPFARAGRSNDDPFTETIQDASGVVLSY